MKALTQTQAASRELEKVLEQFERWRKTRKPGTRIPTELWNAAVSLFPHCTLNQISRSLHLDFVELRKRVNGNVASEKSNGATSDSGFWELRLSDAQTSITECRLRAEDGEGRKVELELKGIATGQLLRLLLGLWEGKR